MGGCVVSVLQSKNNKSVVPDERIKKYRAGGPYNIAVSPATDDCSAIYRFHEDKELTAEKIQERFYNGTLVNLLRECCAKNAKNNAVGYRPFDRIEKTTITDNGKEKPWELLHFKDAVTITFEQLWEKVLNFGAGLKAVGCPAGARVGIYEDTRAEWLMGCYGIWTQGMTAVTVYASLGEDALEYALKEAEVSFIITSVKLAKNLANLCKKANIEAPTIVVTEDMSQEDRAKIGATIFTFEELVTKGKEARGTSDDVVPVTPEDVALIMYTSGTTGDPKGVVMSHGNVHAAVKSVTPRLDMFFGNTQNTRYLAYLPLAHILEFTAENACLLRGTFVGYGTPRSLTDATARPHGDLKEFRPHLICGVPRVYDTIKKSAESRIPPGLKKRVFQTAYDERKEYMDKGMETPYYNEKVFGLIREIVGNNALVILSGGAPMSAKSQEFMRVVTGASVVQGYGLTETCAITTTQIPGDLGVEEIGAIQNGVEVKLRDVDDWKHTDPEPRGEILIRGPVVTKGYYKQPEKTAEAYTADGWFCTGDVGSITKEGNLKIVGRVKALAKNGIGEYIALDSLEVTYVLNDLALPNGVCVLVNPFKSYIAALVLTDESKAMKFAAANGISGEWPAILDKPEFQKKAAESMAATAKAHGKKPFECVKYVKVLKDEWTPENGILTAAFKIKRRAIDTQYKAVIDELFVAE